MSFFNIASQVLSSFELWLMITSELSRIPQLSFDDICEAPHWGQRHKITSHAMPKNIWTQNPNNLLRQKKKEKDKNIR
jgi:hypothetical protein